MYTIVYLICVYPHCTWMCRFRCLHMQRKLNTLGCIWKMRSSALLVWCAELPEIPQICTSDNSWVGEFQDGIEPPMPVIHHPLPPTVTVTYAVGCRAAISRSGRFLYQIWTGYSICLPKRQRPCPLSLPCSLSNPLCTAMNGCCEIKEGMLYTAPHNG